MLTSRCSGKWKDSTSVRDFTFQRFVVAFNYAISFPPLRSTIIEHVMEICRNEAKCGLAYHYCSFQDHPQLLCGDIMASLVDQLQSQISYIPPSLKELQQGRSRDQRASRSADRLMEPLRELISSFTEVYIFIDALDEFDNSHISDLMRLRSSIKKWSNPSLHVLVTSQFHHLSIRESLRVLTNPEDRLDIAADLWNEADIRDHIRSNWQNLLNSVDVGQEAKTTSWQRLKLHWSKNLITRK